MAQCQRPRAHVERLYLAERCCVNLQTARVQRHPVSEGRVPIAVNRLDCAVYEYHDWLSYKATDSRYLSLVVSLLIDCSG